MEILQTLSILEYIQIYTVYIVKLLQDLELYFMNQDFRILGKFIQNK